MYSHIPRPFIQPRNEKTKKITMQINKKTNKELEKIEILESKVNLILSTLGVAGIV